MSPRPPSLSERMYDLWDDLPDLLRRVFELVRGTSARSAYFRLALGAIFLPLIYVGMQALIGELPNLVDNLFTQLGNLGRLFDLLWRLFFPQGEAVPAPIVDMYAKLPRATPQASMLERLGIIIRQFDDDLLQGWIAFLLLPLIWALGRAVHIFEETFQLGSYRAVVENLTAAYFPPFRRTVSIRDASLVMNTTTIHPRRLGGPLHLEVDPGNLAVMEQLGGKVRLVGGNQKPVDINAFERLVRILDLRSHKLELTQELLTRDGVNVVLRQVGFSYTVKQSAEGVDAEAARSLVYRHWLGKSWEDPSARQRDVQLLVSGELAQFASSELEVKDLTQYLSPPEVLEAFPVECQVLQEFVSYFNSRSDHGLQLSWDGSGTWEFPAALRSPEAAQAVENSVHNQSLRIRTARIVPRDYTDAEIIRLAESVLQAYEALTAQNADEDMIVRQLLASYNRILQNEEAEVP